MSQQMEMQPTQLPSAHPVVRQRRDGRWKAYVPVEPGAHNTKKSLGSFATYTEACMAYGSAYHATQQHWASADDWQVAPGAVAWHQPYGPEAGYHAQDVAGGYDSDEAPAACEPRPSPRTPHSCKLALNGSARSPHDAAVAAAHEAAAEQCYASAMPLLPDYPPIAPSEVHGWYQVSVQHQPPAAARQRRKSLGKSEAGSPCDGTRQAGSGSTGQITLQNSSGLAGTTVFASAPSGSAGADGSKPNAPKIRLVRTASAPAFAATAVMQQQARPSLQQRQRERSYQRQRPLALRTCVSSSSSAECSQQHSSSRTVENPTQGPEAGYLPTAPSVVHHASAHPSSGPQPWNQQPWMPQPWLSGHTGQVSRPHSSDPEVSCTHPAGMNRKDSSNLGGHQSGVAADAGVRSSSQLHLVELAAASADSRVLLLQAQLAAAEANAAKEQLQLQQQLVEAKSVAKRQQRRLQQALVAAQDVGRPAAAAAAAGSPQGIPARKRLAPGAGPGSCLPYEHGPPAPWGRSQEAFGGTAADLAGREAAAHGIRSRQLSLLSQPQRQQEEREEPPRLWQRRASMPAIFTTPPLADLHRHPSADYPVDLWAYPQGPSAGSGHVAVRTWQAGAGDGQGFPHSFIPAFRPELAGDRGMDTGKRAKRRKHRSMQQLPVLQDGNVAQPFHQHHPQHHQQYCQQPESQQQHYNPHHQQQHYHPQHHHQAVPADHGTLLKATAHAHVSTHLPHSSPRASSSKVCMAADRLGNGEAAAAAWDAQVMPSWVGSHGATAAASQGQGQAQGMSAEQAGSEDGQGLDDLGSLFKAFLQETADQDEAQAQTVAAAAAACAQAHPGPGAATGAGEAAVCGAASAQEAGCGHSNGMAVEPCNAHIASVLVTEECVAGPAAEDSASAAAAAVAAAAAAAPECLEVEMQAMVGAEDSFEQLLLNDEDLSSWLDG